MAKSLKEISNSVEIYMKEISNTKPLSSQEENELSKRIKSGDRKALKKLVSANLRFVVKVARNYENQGVALEDLISVGNRGLMTAAEKFEGDKNFKFISYAVWWIRQAILTELAESSRVVRVPVNKVQNLNRFTKAYEALRNKNQGEVSIEDLKAELDMTDEEVIVYLGLMQRAVELDKPSSDFDTTPLDMLASNEYEPEFVETGDYKKLLNQFLCYVSDKERAIIKEYFGIDAEHPKTLEEIASSRGITRERVRQIKDGAMKKIQSNVPQTTSIFQF